MSYNGFFNTTLPFTPTPRNSLLIAVTISDYSADPTAFLNLVFSTGGGVIPTVTILETAWSASTEIFTGLYMVQLIPENMNTTLSVIDFFALFSPPGFVGPNAEIAIVFAEYDRLVRAGTSLDRSASFTDTSGTANIGTTIITTQAEELWVGVVGASDGYVGSSPTNGFSVANTASSGSSKPEDIGLTFIDRVVTTVGNVTADVTLPAPAAYTSVSAALFQRDTETPIIDNEFPVATSAGTEDTLLSFDIVSEDEVAGETLNVQIQVNADPPVDAIINGVFQTGWDEAGSTISPTSIDFRDGYSVVIDQTAQFFVTDTITVLVDAYNVFGDSALASYSFVIADFLGPQIINLFPAVNQTSIPINSNISFDIIDTGSGVDVNRLNVIVEARNAIFDGVVQTLFMGDVNEGFTGSISGISQGYSVNIDPSFTFFNNRSYNVIIDGYDLDGYQDGYNNVNLNYNFTTGNGTTVLPTAINEPYNHNITVFFSDEVQNDANLADPANYKIPGDAYVSAVSIDPTALTQVVLTADNLFGHEQFEIIVCNIKDAYGLDINPQLNRATLTIPEPDSDIDVSGFSGSLRTRDNILSIYGDDDYWYAATTGGLDVVNKTTLLNAGFILDGYGIVRVSADANNVYYQNRNPDDAYGIFQIPKSAFVEKVDVAGSVIGKYDQAELPTLAISELNTDDNDTLIVASGLGGFVGRGNDTFIYSSGTDVISAAIDSTGDTLYLATSSGTVEVYYNIRADGYGRSVPDFTYSTVSSPAILGAGELRKILVSTDTSLAESTSNTLYIASTDGVTRIETDESSPGSSETGGISVQYGVEGSGFDFNAIGGESNRVINMDINVEQLQLFVLTDDISEADLEDGLSMINLASNTVFTFIPTDELPPDISDIFFKKLAQS